MSLSRKFSPALVAGFLMASPLVAGQALAAWTLDPANSSLSFASVKKGDVGEVHHFTELAGGVSDTGAASVTIKLGSVETWADIRNDRMREFLFEVTKFPAATVTANFDAAAQKTMKDLKPGATTTVSAPLQLSLHGVSQTINAELLVARLSPTRVLVTPKEMLMLDANKYGLAAGIKKMMDLAQLPSISSAVPVSFVLLFNDMKK
ncbi:YceI family protein [Govanella unica]|uniref:YceI family protein n=1 Tax=Govanella unica TaxID=2975056 RepID=A0A9X3TUI1_9PROT|nr:YceI family protein [Govania unica]MDA5192471.1 YceI family protein [Govania unica]